MPRANGARTGIEPVLLAASIPARPGQRVLEGGAGSGAALLCLAARVPGILGLGIERDPAQAALARANAAANGMDGLAFLAAELETPLPAALAGPFDHAMANPPWHAPGTPSPDPGREAAKRAAPGLFDLWAARLAALPASWRHAEPDHRCRLPTLVLAGLSGARCGGPAVLPFWPKAGQAAKLVLVRAIRGGRGPPPHPARPGAAPARRSLYAGGRCHPARRRGLGTRLSDTGDQARVGPGHSSGPMPSPPAPAPRPAPVRPASNSRPRSRSTAARPPRAWAASGPMPSASASSMAPP